MKLSVSLPVGIPRWFKQRQTTNQQSKQTNILSDSDRQYLSQIKSDLYEIFRKYFCGYSKIIQTKYKKIAYELTISQSN